MPTLLTSRGYIFTVAGTKQRCHACHAPPATRNSRSRRVLGQAVGAPANAFFLCECECQHQIPAKSKSSFKAAAAATLHPASPFFSLSFKARAASSYLRRNYAQNTLHTAHVTRHTSRTCWQPQPQSSQPTPAPQRIKRTQCNTRALHRSGSKQHCTVVQMQQ